MASRATKRPRQNRDAASSSQPATAPSVWPKPEGEMIPIARTWEKTPKKTLESNVYKNRPITDSWDDYDSLYYNEWLGVSIGQTRVADSPTMKKMGIETEVLRILQLADLGHIATMHHKLYPDLVRQFMATVRCYFPEEDLDAQKGMLTFMVEGVRYRVPFRDICEIYGFSPEPRGLSFPSFTAVLPQFWSLFANRVFSSGVSLFTDIRHPVIRYVVRLIALTFYNKNEPNKARNHEMTLLYIALRNVVRLEDPFEVDVNMGAVFAEYLVSMKTTPLTLKKGKKDFTMGSLLTPIFAHCRINLSSYSAISEMCTADADHLERSHWLQRRMIWCFKDEGGHSRRIQLPQPTWMDIFSDVRLLRFDVALDDSSPDSPPQPPVPSRSSRAAAARTSTDGAGTSGQSTRYPRHHFTFPSYPAEPMTDAEHRTWVGKGLKAIWDAMAGMAECVRPRTPSPPASPREKDD